MGFLTESTTVVDAILTDEGRRRIANGEFEISKFTLFDDEIIYSKAQQTNPSSKFNTTAVFEAISENTRAGKYKLLSLIIILRLITVSMIQHKIILHMKWNYRPNWPKHNSRLKWIID